jgi:hypothetical protein
MRKLKSEHAGAKNGGGHYGKREEAKRLSKRQRREDAKRAVRDRADAG